MNAEKPRGTYKKEIGGRKKKLREGEKKGRTRMKISGNTKGEVIRSSREIITQEKKNVSASTCPSVERKKRKSRTGMGGQGS